MYKQDMRGNILYSAVGVGHFIMAIIFWPPNPPHHHHLLLHQPKVLCIIGMEIELQDVRYE